MPRLNQICLTALSIMMLMLAVLFSANMASRAQTDSALTLKGDRLQLAKDITETCGGEAWPAQDPDCVEDILMTNGLDRDVRVITIARNTGPNTTTLVRKALID
ncbi:hypothetical protein [Coralliovum pocilloporae]|uniref:hypothetical protein n=1 Tax=Coralliovum pocilloporae TaxID=3066369 RepID=UPI003306B1F8